jgi:hypothetical protein
VRSRLETYKREQILKTFLIEKKEKNKVLQRETCHFRIPVALFEEKKII